MLDGIIVFIVGSFTGMIGAALWEAFCELTRPQRRRVIKKAATRVVSKAPTVRKRTAARPVKASAGPRHVRA